MLEFIIGIVLTMGIMGTAMLLCVFLGWLSTTWIGKVLGIIAGIIFGICTLFVMVAILWGLLQMIIW